MKAVIIDDEHLSRVGIINISKEYTTELEFIGEANSVSSGIQLIKEKKPDLVFLDIQMGDGTGFDLLEQFPSIEFQVIFITAYPEYQSRAEKFGLVDYLLKPIDFELFEQAVNKASEIFEYKQIKNVLAKSKKRQIIIPNREGHKFILISDIVWCETVNSERKTKFVLRKGEDIVANGHLKIFVEKLINHNFIRVHASFLVNVDYIDMYQPMGAAGILKMKYHNKVSIPVSRKYRDAFKDFLDDLNSDFMT